MDDDKMKLFRCLSLLLLFISLLACDELFETYGFRDVFYDQPEKKMWAHRVNSLDEAKAALKVYPGIEVDVVYDFLDRDFEVRHDVEGEASNTSLEDYLVMFEQLDSSYLWVDLKNLNWLTSSGVAQRMKELLAKYNMQDRCIIESSRLWKLRELNAIGLYTAWWAPHVEADHTGQDSLACLRTIRENNERYHFNALSIHFSMYNYLNKHFPEQNYLIWTNNMRDWERDTVMERLISRENVKIVLDANWRNEMGTRK